MDKIKISESQLRQMFREEGGKIKKEIILKAVLNKIDSELNELNEVHAGEDMNPGKDGVHSGQKKPVFTKKGTHLVEDEMEIDDNTEMETPEIGAPEMEMGDNTEIETPVENTGNEVSKEAIIDALQNLANSLNLSANIEIVSDEEADTIQEPEGEDIDLDVDVETGVEDVAGEEEPAEEESAEEESAEEESEEESVDELKNVTSEEEVSGAVQENTQHDAKKQRLTEEVNRWKFLAGLK